MTVCQSTIHWCRAIIALTFIAFEILRLFLLKQSFSCSLFPGKLMLLKDHMKNTLGLGLHRNYSSLLGCFFVDTGIDDMVIKNQLPMERQSMLGLTLSLINVSALIIIVLISFILGL